MTTPDPSDLLARFERDPDSIGPTALMTLTRRLAEAWRATEAELGALRAGARKLHDALTDDADMTPMTEWSEDNFAAEGISPDVREAILAAITDGRRPAHPARPTPSTDPQEH